MPNKQEGLMFRVPATQAGEEFIANLKPYLNKDSYKLTKRYTGPRPHGTPQGSTLKENATSMRVYVKSQREEDNPWKYINKYIARGRELERKSIEADIAESNSAFDEVISRSDFYKASLKLKVDEVDRLNSEVLALNKRLEEPSRNITLTEAKLFLLKRLMVAYAQLSKELLK